MLKCWLKQYSNNKWHTHTSRRSAKKAATKKKTTTTTKTMNKTRREKKSKKIGASKSALASLSVA